MRPKSYVVDKCPRQLKYMKKIRLLIRLNFFFRKMMAYDHLKHPLGQAPHSVVRFTMTLRVVLTALIPISFLSHYRN